MDARRLLDPTEFLSATNSLLLRDEARHNLILGLAGTLRDRPGYYPDFRLWIVERDSEVVAAALQTPPLNLVLAQPIDEDALRPLAHTIAGAGIDLPGVVAATPEVDLFADAWTASRGTTRRLRRRQRIYRLEEVRPLAGIRGRPRRATDGDRPLLVRWLEAFADETLADLPSPATDAERVVEARLGGENSGFLLWDDGEPVSMSGWGGATPNGIRIGPVYTPPERRGRGYGSAVTAAVSAEQLAGGRQFCFLYTDLANPTSNKIYLDLGYEPVCDSVDYVFELG